MSKAQETKDNARKVRQQIARRYVDSSMLNINVYGSTVYLTGVLRALRGHADIELKSEMEKISQILRTIPGIRDVVWDVSERT